MQADGGEGLAGDSVAGGDVNDANARAVPANRLDRLGEHRRHLLRRAAPEALGDDLLVDAGQRVEPPVVVESQLLEAAVGMTHPDALLADRRGRPLARLRLFVAPRDA